MYYHGLFYLRAAFIGSPVDSRSLFLFACPVWWILMESPLQSSAFGIFGFARESSNSFLFATLGGFHVTYARVATSRYEFGRRCVETSVCDKIGGYNI